MSNLYSPSAASKSETYYDNLGDVYDDMHYKKKKGAAHLTGVEVVPIMPSEGEVRLIGNRNK